MSFVILGAGNFAGAGQGVSFFDGRVLNGAIADNGVTTIRGGRSYNPYGYNRRYVGYGYGNYGGYGYGGRYVFPSVRPSHRYPVYYY